MIKANELRIGNNYMVGGQLITATAEDILKCRARPTLRRPIPLTPEILEKCGFCIISNPNHTNSFLCYKPMLKLVIDSDSKNITLRDYSGVQKSITHLHQLQNLYHALTGEELTYNAQ